MELQQISESELVLMRILWDTLSRVKGFVSHYFGELCGNGDRQFVRLYPAQTHGLRCLTVQIDNQHLVAVADKPYPQIGAGNGFVGIPENAKEPFILRE
jgi:hypothetical protein